ncbi:MAG: hypothetical protein CTY13_03485 [Methylobacter sp.]|nr:MAG: hypothetical protein CTY13_03485 [Methylobacter sp.]
MPAFRGKNLRSGDLAEQLGLTLIQYLALVAPVPRTEDVGVDAVVTLLRDFDSQRYIAEDSFFVQIKSASIKSIKFDSVGTSWLYALDLPFFVASVDRLSSSIKLYCAHRLSDAFITNHARDSLTLHLNDLNTENELVESDDNNVHIGPPVLEWSLSTLEEEGNIFPETFYKIVKEHVLISKDNINTRKVGWAVYVRWKTNELPNRIGFKNASSRTPNENLENAADAMAPYFFVWHQEIMRTGNWDEAKSIFSLLEKTKLMIENGVFPLIKPFSD